MPFQGKIYYITMTESVNFAGRCCPNLGQRPPHGFLIAGHRSQPFLQHRAISRTHSQHRSKDPRFMATFRVSHTQAIIAQFRDFDHRFLAIGQLHGSNSLASSKRHRKEGLPTLQKSGAPFISVVFKASSAFEDIGSERLQHGLLE